mgnify:CR=1 FL=1
MIYTVWKGYIFRANIITTSTPYTHMMAKTFFKIIYLMHHFKSHSISLIFPKSMSSCHIRVTIYMTCSPNPSSFSGFSIILIEYILGSETSTSYTYKNTSSTVIEKSINISLLILTKLYMFFFALHYNNSSMELFFPTFHIIYSNKNHIWNS